MQTACAAAESCTECLDCHLKAIRRRAETNFCNFCRKAKKSFYQAVLDDIKLTNEPLAASLKEVNGRCLRTSAELFFQIYCSFTPLYDPDDDAPLTNFFVQYYEDNPCLLYTSDAADE